MKLIYGIFSLLILLTGVSCKKEQLNKTIRVMVSSESQLYHGVRIKPTSLSLLLHNKHGDYYRSVDLRPDEINLSSIQSNALLLGSGNDISADELKQVTINFSRSGLFIKNHKDVVLAVDSARFRINVAFKLEEVNDIEIRFNPGRFSSTETSDNYTPSIIVTKK